jgi:hypothetical protein
LPERGNGRADPNGEGDTEPQRRFILDKTIHNFFYFGVAVGFPFGRLKLL